MFPEMVTSVTDLPLEMEPIEIPWPPEQGLLFLKLLDASGEWGLQRMDWHVHDVRAIVDSDTVILVLNDRVLNSHVVGGNVETL